MWTVDFETKAIGDWPEHYPPKPVGVAIKHNDEAGVYYAWEHPTKNNTEREIVEMVLHKIWNSSESVLFHHAKFDMAVAEKHFGLPPIPPNRLEDTTFLLFLHDPLSKTLSLKPSAEAILGWPPEEQDAVREWLMDHDVVPASATKKWGAFICEAPGDLVGKYAIGDVDRTFGLFEELETEIADRDMYDAYQREVQLAPILLRSEFEGIRVDCPRLEKDIPTYQAAFDKASLEIKRILHQDNEEFNLDSGVQLANAVRASGLHRGEDDWPKTKTGKFSTSRDTLELVITDEHLMSLLAYRGILKTLLGTFMKPWLTKASANNGRLHPSWNQVKSDEYGAKTGRLSCSNPNLQNIPTDFDGVVIPEGYPLLPHVRKYILPDEGEVFVSADYHSQEIRMLGHFAEGALQSIYQGDPSADIHQVAADIITDTTGLHLTRKQTKIVAFSILYGVGMMNMAKKLKVTPKEARLIKSTYLKTLAGVKAFMEEVEDRAAAKEFVRSWGGRELFAPAPIVLADGRHWNKDYVLLNYLIQGSSADQTKQGTIDYDRTKVHGRFLATVHDEICISVSKEHLATEVKLLTDAMEAGHFDIPMRATVKVGANWDEMEDYA